MGRKAEKAEEQVDNIDVQLQKAFNMIRDNNRILLESANEKKDN